MLFPGNFFYLYSKISIFFCENWYEALFYNNEQTQKYKLKIWIPKLFYCYPRKSVFLVFKEKHWKQNLSSGFGSNSALKTINTLLLFCSVFLKTHKKVINHQKRHFGHFLKINIFFSCIFKNTYKWTFVFLLFQKLKLKKKL